MCFLCVLLDIHKSILALAPEAIFTGNSICHCRGSFALSVWPRQQIRPRQPHSIAQMEKVSEHI